MKVAVVCDQYKLKVFRKVLRKAGYKGEEFPGITRATTTLQIQFVEDEFDKLRATVEECERKAKRGRGGMA